MNFAALKRLAADETHQEDARIMSAGALRHGGRWAIGIGESEGAS